MEIFKNLLFQLLAQKFIAGRNLESAIKKAQEISQKGMYPVLNILGEGIKDLKKVNWFKSQYLNLIGRLSETGLIFAHLSIKPSQLGLDISEEIYRNNQIDILRAMGKFLPLGLLEIDAEEGFYREKVIKIVLDLVKIFPNLRLACQINLKDAQQKIKKLTKAGISIRLCKGDAYLGDIQNPREIRERFLEAANYLAQWGKNSVIATHDLYLLDRLVKKDLGIQVLLGIENNLAKKLAREKEVGIYLAWGKDWWPFVKRRWKSLPKIFWRNFLYRIKKRAKNLRVFLDIFITFSKIKRCSFKF